MLQIRANVKPLPAAPSTIPLIDLFFILLIFFMISNSVVFWPGAKVETSVRLPRSREPSMSEADKLVVTITQSGRLFFNDRNVAWDELERELSELVRESRIATGRRRGEEPAEAGRRLRSPLLVLRADKGIAYDRIMAVMSLARSLGLGVYLVTDTSDTGDTAAPGILGEDVD
jgi:biopolymer transport protein ExbD